MKNCSSILCMLATALIMTSTAMGEMRQGAFTISPFVGGYTFDGVQHLKTNVATGLGLGYNVTRNWGAEGQFTWVPLQTSQGDIPGEYSLFNLHGDVLYHFLPENRLVPFVALGGGLSRTEGLTYDNTDAILTYGGGVKYFLNDRLALRGDVRQIVSFHSGGSGGMDYWSNFEYTVGLAFQFGGTKPGAPRVPAEQTAAGAPVTPVRDQKPLPAPSAAPIPRTSPAPSAPLEEQTSWQAKEGIAELHKDKVVLTGMTIRPDALELNFTKSFYYEIHVLSKPSRLAIDIPGAVNGLGVDTITINRTGIATVRFETRNAALRCVLYPAEGISLPSRIDVINDFHGLLVHQAPPVRKDN